jgi:hypothetical protein
MKQPCCKDENSKCTGKWIISISAVVGFLTVAGVVMLWLCKKYKKCTSVFTDDGSIDCSGCDMEEGM